MMMVIEVITFCLAGYSVRSWSRPLRGTAPLLLEGRRQASMSRLWGHSEYSDLSDWSLEYPVSTESCGSKERKKKWKREKKERRMDSLRIRCEWWLGEGSEKWTTDWSWYCCWMPHTHTVHTQWHINAHTYKFSHTHSPLVLLSDTQMVWAVDELSVSLSVLVTAEINNPTGQKSGKDQISWMKVVRVCAPEWVCVCVWQLLWLQNQANARAASAHPTLLSSSFEAQLLQCTIFRLNPVQHHWPVYWIDIMATHQYHVCWLISKLTDRFIFLKASSFFAAYML